jgi:hypothetical protein
MADRKQIPRQTFGNLIPPKEDYVYFESPQEFPFRANATGFDLVNAGWLMDASMLVYGGENFIRERVARLAGEVPGAQVRLFNGKSTQALVLQLPEFAIVAFRGTRIEIFPDFIAWLQRRRSRQKVAARASGNWVFLNWRDMVSDAKFAMGRDGIHIGFRQALDQPGVWDAITAHLATIADRRVWFTGHSLGAALATISAARYGALRSIQGLYTFGSPRVGKKRFLQTVPSGGIRFVNNADMVTRLPPPLGGYKHAGQLKFIGSNGIIFDDANGRDPLKKRIGATLAALKRLVPKGVRNGITKPGEFIKRLRNLDIELPQNRWSDHAPVNYACRIWNAVDAACPESRATDAHR